MEKLDLQSYQERVENQKGISLIKFGAEWCGPCKAFAPILEETSKEVGTTIDFYEVNVDEEPELSQKFSVRSVPATFILKNGQIKKTLIGIQDKSTIIEMLKSI